MLYDYIKAIDTNIISPTPKQHKAMLTLLSQEVGVLTSSPLLKGSALAKLLIVSPTFLSNHRRHYTLMLGLDKNPEALKLYDEAEAYMISSGGEDMLKLLPNCARGLVPQTIVNDVLLYIPKELQDGI